MLDGGAPEIVGGALTDAEGSPLTLFDLPEPLQAARVHASATTARRRQEVECFIPETALQQAQVARIALQDEKFRRSVCAPLDGAISQSGSGNPAILGNPTDRRLCVPAFRQVCRCLEPVSPQYARARLRFNDGQCFDAKTVR